MIGLHITPWFPYRVSSRRAPYLLAVRQESRQRIAPCRAGLATPNFPLSDKAEGLALQTRLRLKQQVQTPPFHLASVRRHRRGSVAPWINHSISTKAGETPSVEPVMGCGKWRSPGLLFEPQASLQDRPFHASQRRVARRAEAAGHASLGTFLSCNKKVPRLPGRDPARKLRRPIRTTKDTPHD